MYRSVISSAPDQAVKGVNFAHQMPFAQAANRGVTGHRTDHIFIKTDKRDPQTHARSNRRSLCAGVATTYNNDVEIGRHASRIYQLCPRVKKECASVSRETGYLPTQNFPKTVSSRSSVCARPVRASSASRTCRKFSAIISQSSDSPHAASAVAASSKNTRCRALMAN